MFNVLTGHDENYQPPMAHGVHPLIAHFQNWLNPGVQNLLYHDIINERELLAGVQNGFSWLLKPNRLGRLIGALFC